MKDVPPDVVLPVDKPSGPTSHDVVVRARRALRTRRVGHTGTLDPFASGLLVLCAGRATRIAEYLSALDKTYEAIVRLGTTTDTLDRDGEVLEERAGWEALRPGDLSAALRRFEGEIDQVPPQFSAKKVAGEAMHRRARRGEHVDLAPQRVSVHELSLLAVDLPELSLRVRCSSGTYVRALARDLGEALGVGAHLSGLRRTSVGALTLAQALPTDALEDPDRVRVAALPPLEALAHLPALEVGEAEARRLGEGRPVELPDAASPRVGAGGDTRSDGGSGGLGRTVVISHRGALLAVAEAREGLLHPKKVFHA